MAAASELDDRPGPARDELVRLQKEWMDSIAICFRSGISEGHFRADADPEQFAHDLYSMMLGYHHAQRLLRDPAADSRARASMEALLAAARRRGPSRVAPARRRPAAARSAARQRRSA